MTKLYPKFLLSLTLLLCTAPFSTIAAQECGTQSPQQIILEDATLSDAEKAQQIAEIEDANLRSIEKYRNSVREGEKADVLIIPVVFHVFHKYGPENISEAQCRDEIRVLNEYFNAENPSLGQLVEEFKPIAGDSEIEFRIATVDPDGNCTNGIVRYYEPRTYFDDRNDIQQLKRDHGWPRENYMNVYVVGSISPGASGGVIAGYSQFPGFGAANTDGNVMAHNYVGSIGTGNPSNSATNSHEVGHWLNLYHTWGNCASAGEANACNCDDGVDDTPNTVGHPSTCDLSAQTCGSLDNVQNIMDYSSCAVNFTIGQSERMRAAIATYDHRANLVTPENLAAVGADYAMDAPPTTLCLANMEFNDVKLNCVGEPIPFVDRSYHNIVERTWTFQDGDPATSSEYEPSVVFTSGGVKTITLEVSNGVNTMTVTREITITDDGARGALPFADDIENVDLSTFDYYIVNNEGGSPEWVVNTSVSKGSGTNSLYLNNRNGSADDGVDEITSSTIDLSGVASGNNVEFTFDVAFARQSFSNSDQLKIAFSNDCGVTWSTVGSLTRSTLASASNTTGNFVPTQDDWKSFTYNVPANLITSNFQFRLQWVPAGGNNVYIDNINMQEVPVGIEELTAESINLKAFPNPTKGELNLSLDLDKAQHVSVSLLNVVGKENAELFSGNMNAGNNTLKRNLEVAPGIYMLRIATEKGVVSKKLMIN